MKVALLAGGLGTRLAEETEVRPKPMVEIGGKPILWHIMKHYSAHGFNNFVVALGYRGEYIKRYMVDYSSLSGSLTVDFRDGRVVAHEGTNGGAENWTVDLVETGLDTQTGGRMQKMAPYLQGGTFMMTYGDGVANIDLTRLLAFHRAHGKLATVTAVRPPARFGGLSFDGDLVRSFTEKPQIGEGWINGGFFVLEPGVLDFIAGDETPWEHAPLERLAAAGELVAYRHEEFWQCMDTLRDLRLLEGLWQDGGAPWKLWDGEA
jgi:glucose-1-phosphate cytidylyltransferase